MSWRRQVGEREFFSARALLLLMGNACADDKIVCRYAEAAARKDAPAKKKEAGEED